MTPDDRCWAWNRGSYNWSGMKAGDNRAWQLAVAESTNMAPADQTFDIESWLADLLVDYWLSTRQKDAEIGDNNAV